MQSLPPALQPLAAYRQFIAYQLVPDTARPGKTHKYPINIRTAERHDAHDAAIWVSFEEAAIWVAGAGRDYGVGFVFTEADPFWFLDVDNCLTEAGQWSEVALDLCQRFAGAAVEVSQSGRGLHLFGTGHVPRPRKVKGSGFDLYTEARFVALTGTHAMGDASTRHDAALATLVGEFLTAEAYEDGEWRTEPVEGWTGYVDDEELLAVALRSVSLAGVFGGRASFADLWFADEPKLALAYPPDQGGESYDASAADMALAQHLAFHTGNNHERIVALMERSSLKRDKWEREDYLPRTIRKACAQQRDVFKRREVQPRVYEAQQVDQARQEKSGIIVPQAVRVTGQTFLGADEQIKMFNGCCYISEAHRIFAPDGHLYRHDQFRALFGGYSFPMDGEGKRVSRDAWECFTESQLVHFPKARGTCFKPELPTGVIIEDGGRQRVNTFVPIYVSRMVGDVTPFLNHMAKMLPDESDRLTLLAYMAACVQHQGVKFQWAPLVQGVEGNGKTLLALCVAEAIGARYVHWPLAADIDNNFNSWLWGNIFYAVDEIFIEDSRTHVLETLKPMITANRGGIQITAKGVDQQTADICGNFIFLTNHRNAIHLKPNERRVAPFFTAQQRKEDLRRDGMDEAYFRKLFEWFEDGGYAKVSEFLHTWQIPREMDPRFHSRKPITSSTAEAVKAGQGRAEQEIWEQIEQDAPGFAGGWISSTALERLMDNKNIRLPKVKYRDTLQEMGYEPHPGLSDGRVSQVVIPDNTKPRLYIRIGHADGALVEARAIAAAYEAAQSGLGRN